MKIKILLLTGILLFVGELSAQNQSRNFSKDDIIGKKWSIVLQKTNLSAEDVLKVEPIFKATELETWSLIEKNRSMFRNSRSRDANVKVDYEAINEAMINFDVESAMIQKNYYLKLKKVVTPDVINKLLNAEKSYKRELMQNMPDRRKNSNPPPKQ